MQRDGPAEPQPALAHYLERAARHQLRALKCLTQSVPRSQAVRSASQRQRERAWAIEHLLLARAWWPRRSASRPVGSSTRYWSDISTA
jgi:hypothetical protein